MARSDEDIMIDESGVDIYVDVDKGRETVGDQVVWPYWVVRRQFERTNEY